MFLEVHAGSAEELDGVIREKVHLKRDMHLWQFAGGNTGLTVAGWRFLDSCCFSDSSMDSEINITSNKADLYRVCRKLHTEAYGPSPTLC